MESATKRKLPLRDEDLPESRTRPRLENEPMQFGIILTSPEPPSLPPPAPPTLNGDQDLRICTDLKLYFYEIEQQPCTPAAREQTQLPPQIPPPQPDNGHELPLPHPPILPIHVPQPPPPPPPQPPVAPPPRRNRRNPTNAPPRDKPATIQPPFTWATDRRAQVHSLKYLTERGITTISGEVQCKRCEQRYEIEYNLEEKFSEVGQYVAENKYDFRERAPAKWMNPPLLTCKYCHQENSVKPKMAEKKRSVNWLFLLLGQMLGCCTLDQLKYFCKHTGNHRTGAKDRVLFLTYLRLCKQIYPDGPFDRA